eukprot:TRINITY_DN8091_c0_g1_i1.p1 TRINITY_DN8091_c0_g1~~TRINITY_DN8091_c0_g1_i1.p1  ORF type:complete len:203 (+),score=50.86 TRINITY_DN8091_c0_g1_i1:218-826(+)
MTSRTVHVLETGGTINGLDLNNTPDMASVTTTRVIEHLHACTPDWLLAAHLHEVAVDYNIVMLCQKDSRQLELEDQQKLADTITETVINARKHAQEEGCPGFDLLRFLVPHGTFKMPDTAEYLNAQLSSQVKEQASVVLVGSLIPLLLDNTDGPANLELAMRDHLLLPADSLKPGVLVCMGSRFWEPGTVKKDLDTGEFVPK